MRSGMRQAPSFSPQHPWRMLAISLALSLLFGVLGMGEPLEDGLRVARNRLAQVAPSGDIVVVTIDDASQKQVGSWPWPREKQAELIDRITAAGAKQIVYDFTNSFANNVRSDDAFTQAVSRSGRVVLAAHMRSGPDSGAPINILAERNSALHARLGTISTPYNYDTSVWRLPYALPIGGQTYRSYASIMSDVSGASGELFPLNYRIDVDRVPRVSAGRLFNEDLGARLRGKTVIIGGTSENIHDNFHIPGLGLRGGVFIHVIGAETLKRSRPVSLGWLPMLLALLPVLTWLARMRKARGQLVILAVAFAATLAVPCFSESAQWFVDVTPALFMVLCVGIGLIRRRYRLRGTVNVTTGLPNLVALRANHHQRDRALIAARVINYSQLASAVTEANERALVDQIVQRLTVGAKDHVIFQGDEGIFAWLTEPGTAIGHHVEALHSLFRNPARIGEDAFDLNITFGVEIGSGRPMTQRLNSALVAADEAASEGLKWKYHDPERMKDANWRLSLLSQLDQAIENGEVWVAFQPQLDLASGRLRGAEALARWTHPEKGPISPQEFVSAAEQGGRIEKLTLFVLDRAVAAAARINSEGEPFDMAVNLSARMLTMKSLPLEVQAVLARHNLDPARLTLELTETAALARDGSDLGPLLKLRDLGVRLSIDDYGTGLSTLDYLKKVPASELKIDQSFVKAMGDHRSDLVMVQSTIALAHSLDRTVVAEGVETQDALDLLRSLGCDTAQGFLIGRPMSAKGLLRRLHDERRRRAA